MTDIVERLRLLDSFYIVKPTTYAEAADEIERLRSDLDREVAAHVADLAEIERLRAALKANSPRLVLLDALEAEWMGDRK